MKKTDDQRRTLARVKRAESAAHATILRAFDKVIHTLQNELREYRIRQARRPSRRRNPEEG